MNSEAKSNRFLPFCFGLALFIAFLGLVVVKTRVVNLWDDSLMWQRYARHLISGHGLRWNLDEAPTFGLTSLGYTFVSVIAYIASPDSAVLAGFWGSVATACLAFGLTVYLGYRILGKGALGLLWTLAILVLAGLLRHDAVVRAESGMDTCLSLSWVVALYGLSLAQTSSPNEKRAVVLAVMFGLTYIVRPDYLLLAVPAAILLFFEVKPFGLRYRGGPLVIAAAMFFITLAACKLYFGTALPLSYFVKKPGFYGPEFEITYLPRNNEAFQGFMKLTNYLPNVLLGFAAPALCLLVRDQKRAYQSFLFAATALVYIAYFKLRVNHIMAGGFRFYIPSLLPLTVSASLAARSLLDRYRSRIPEKAIETAAWLAAAALFAGGASFAKKGLPGFRAGLLNDDGFYAEKASTKWRDIKGLRSIDGIVVATTEVGFPGAYLPRAKVVDVSGLNCTDIAQNGFHAEPFLEKYKPDVFYTMHDSYGSWLKDLYQSQSFKHDYEFLDSGGKEFPLGVAIRRNSPIRNIIHQMMPTVVSALGKQAP